MFRKQLLGELRKKRKTKEKCIIIVSIQQRLIFFLCSFPYAQIAEGTGSSGIHKRIRGKILAFFPMLEKFFKDGHMQMTEKLRAGKGHGVNCMLSELPGKLLTLPDCTGVAKPHGFCVTLRVTGPA